MSLSVKRSELGFFLLLAMTKVTSLLAWAVLLASVAGHRHSRGSSTPEKSLEVDPDYVFPRLSPHVIPTRYDLRLKVTMKTLSYGGKVGISLNVNQPTDLIMLHTNSTMHRITHVTINLGHGETLKPKYRIDVENLIIDPRRTIPKRKIDLWIEFSGSIDTTEWRGFYTANYQQNGTAEPQFMAITNNEPASARKIFPCFDEPEFKAHFLVRVTAEAEFVILSNMAEDRNQTYKKNGVQLRRVFFKESLKMSTYLFALAIGRFHCMTRAAKDGTRIKVCTRPGLLARAQSASVVTTAAYDYFKDLFGVNPTVEKIDLVACPEFKTIAMENTGLFIGKEVYLVRNDSWKAYDEQILYHVIGHEMSHVWFGNLVTVKWWNQFWLKEGFASYLAHHFALHFNPSHQSDAKWHMLRHNSKALFRDARDNESRAIERDIKTNKDISEIFSRITYEKGASLLRMMENYLNYKQPERDLFLEASQDFLKIFRHKAPDVSEFWNVLEHYAGEDLESIFSVWLTTPGYPVLNVSHSETNLGHVDFAQSRFALPGSTVWNIPIQHVHHSERCALSKRGCPKHTTMMTDRTASLKSRNNTLIVNPEAIGFYVVNYDRLLFRKAVDTIRNLPEVARFVILRDTTLLANYGYHSVERVLEVVEELLKDRFGLTSLVKHMMELAYFWMKNEMGAELLKTYEGPMDVYKILRETAELVL